MQLRKFFPKTLFGRMLSIILVPMIIVQVITVFIFYERHWDTVTRHMAANLASEIAFLIDGLGTAPMPNKLTWSLPKAGSFSISQSVLNRRQPESNAKARPKTYPENMLQRELNKRISQDWQVDVDTDPNLIFIDVQFDTGLLEFMPAANVFSVQQAGRFLAGPLAVRF